MRLLPWVLRAGIFERPNGCSDSSKLQEQEVKKLAETIRIGEAALTVWPADQAVDALDEGRQVLRTRFGDHQIYDPLLREAIEARVRDPAVGGQHDRALGGTKLYGLERSDNPAVRLLNARAVELFKIAAGAPQGVIDVGWVNVFRRGDYITAHSHVRALGSVVYCLDEGEPDPGNRYAGQLCIIDPRYPPCCKIKQGCMTNPRILSLKAGTMVAFPAALVHAVHPYEGNRARITFAWNITKTALPGDTLSLLNLDKAARFDAE